MFGKSSGEKQPGGRYSILMIDDEPGDLVLAKQVLEKEGYEVLWALDGRTGIWMAQEKKPDLIVLECLLPGMTGADVCRMLKGDPRTEAIPVVFLTADQSNFNLIQCYDAGADFYMNKPVKPSYLLSEIQTILKEMNAPPDAEP